MLKSSQEDVEKIVSHRSDLLPAGTHIAQASEKVYSTRKMSLSTNYCQATLMKNDKLKVDSAGDLISYV